MKKTYTYNPKNLKKSIEDASKWEPSKEPQDCSICKDLESSNSAYQETRDPEGNSYLPEASEKLEYIWKVESRTGGIKKCPQCNQLYSYEASYEWFTNGTEDEQHLERISKTNVKKIINTTLGYYVPPSKITHEGNLWEIGF